VSATLVVATAIAATTIGREPNHSGTAAGPVPTGTSPQPSAYQGPFFPDCGGISDQTVGQLTRVSGLVNTARNSVGCQWLAGGGILGPHFSFTWYRGTPIGRERKTEELSRASVDDLTIDGHNGFIATGTDPALGNNTCEVGIESSSSDDFVEWSISFAQKTFPDPCQIAKDVSRQSIAAIASSQIKTGPTGTPNSASAKYPNLLKECAVLTSDALAKALGVDASNIQPTFVGAVCRWQAANPAGLVDITRFWFEQGNLDNERKTAEGLKYQLEDRSIAGLPSIVMRPNDPNGACGVASGAGGVVGWWVNPQVPGIDACGQAMKLMEATLATNP
jgi:Protein of unknown function (DUF3558)